MSKSKSVEIPTGSSLRFLFFAMLFLVICLIVGKIMREGERKETNLKSFEEIGRKDLTDLIHSTIIKRMKQR